MFANLNFARVLIISMLVVSIPLGWMAWERNGQIAELRAALAKQGEVENTVRDIQALSRRHSALVREVDAEGIVGQANPRSYITKIAYREEIELAQLKIDPSTREPIKGVVDNIYRVTSSQKDKSFGRVRLGNFFFMLEEKSRRVRVTELKLETANRRLKPHEFPDDQWTFECKVTSREKKDS